MSKTTQETLDLVKEAQGLPKDEILGKSWTQSGSAISGLTAYDLEAPAKLLYPVLTPLRNMIPRIGGGTGIQANWRAITGINTGLMQAGVSEGNRGGLTTHTTADYLAAFKGIGLEDYVTFESDYSARGFDDTKARAVEGLLRSLMIREESIILGGNTSVALGTTPTPSVTPGSNGSIVGTVALSVICVALTSDGWWQAGGFNNGFVGTTGQNVTTLLQQQIIRVNADGSSDTYGGGLARKSAAGTASVTSSTGNALATVTAVQGAVGYAWYWGLSGAETLGAITNINSVNITVAAGTGTQTAASLAATDYSTNALIFDGLLAQVAKSGSNGYYNALATGTAGTGTVLTTDGSGGVNEITTAFASFYDNYRLSPQIIFCHRQQQKDITNRVVAGGGSALFRYNLDGNDPGKINSAGTVVNSLLNQVTGETVQLVVHPNMPVGTMLFYSKEIPYKLSNVDSVVRILTRQDYYQLEWPRTTRKYQYGVYADQVLQNYFPPAFGIISNIAAG